MLAVCLVWPMIWVGGLVTTYDAGMAVPDWPNTYGYNLLLYPLSSWFHGPFDLFIEHGHRLLGVVIGLVAIGMLVAAAMTKERKWVVKLSALVLVMVIGQGILGGIRVLLVDRSTAMIHGCVAPICFALCVAMAVVTSQFWLSRGSMDKKNLPNVTRAMVIGPAAVLVLSYLQLVLGAQLRHVQPTASPSHFAGIVVIHVLAAFLLWISVAVCWLLVRRCGDLTLSRPAMLLIPLVGVQIALGLGTWVVNYGWPTFLKFLPGATSFLLRAKGYLDSIIVTAHVATGSLILAVATLTVLRLLRVRYLLNVDHQTTLATT